MLAVPSLPLHDSAQQPAPQSSQQPITTIKAQAREVLLPVTVRKKGEKGELVTNLTAADFTLTEDGRPQTIKSFSVQSDLPFLLGLLADTSQSMSGALDAERKAAEKFVELMLPADAKNAKVGDQAFLIHFDREVELLEDFTNSRDKLDRELEQMGPSERERNNPQGPETSDSNGGYGNGGQNGGYGGQNGPYGGQNGGYGGQNGGYGGQRGGESRGNRLGGTQLYDAIFLASDDMMKPKTGRKALVVFSDGVDRGSKETLNEAIDAAERANVSVYTIYFKGSDQNQNSYPGGMGRHGGMGGGGMGYPGGYPGGMGYPRFPRPSQTPGVDGKKIMQQIATRTGARFFEAKKKENLEEIYNDIAQELRGQYLLTYTPDKVDNDGGYHKISLTAKKEDVVVVTREGYYAPGGDTK